MNKKPISDPMRTLVAVMCACVAFIAAYLIGAAAFPPVPVPPVVKQVRVAKMPPKRNPSEKARKAAALFAVEKATERTVDVDGMKYWKPIIVDNADGTSSVTVMFLGAAIDVKAMGEEKRAKDPEEFEKWAKYRVTSAEELARKYDENVAYLSSVDVSWMDEQMKTEFQALIDKYKTASDYTRRSAIWDIPYEERKVIDPQLFRLPLQASAEMKKWRPRLMARICELIELNADEAAAFTAKVNEIADYTSRHRPLQMPQ